jgi:Pvc16 N-terminal domain
MIDQAVINTITSLNEYFLKRTGIADVVDADSLTREDVINIPISKIILTVVGIEEDRVTANRKYYNSDEQNYQQPEVRINLMVLFTSTHKDYKEKLRNLSFILTFFQTHPLLSSKIEGIKHLAFELQTLTFEQQSYIWGLLAMKYQPCVVYRIRVITLRDKEVIMEGSPIKVIQINASS